jgi:hypothetical protein
MINSFIVSPKDVCDVRNAPSSLRKGLLKEIDPGKLDGKAGHIGILCPRIPGQNNPQASFQSLPSLKFLFRMNNRFNSTLESGTYTPMTYVKEIDQGGLFIKNKNYFQSLPFDLLHQKVVVESKEKKERQEISLPPGTYDPLTMFARFYFKEDILPGKDIQLSIFDGLRLRQLVFHIDKGKIKSKMFGEVETVRLESKTSFSTFLDQEGTIRIWYTTDGSKIPILFETDLPIGKIRFELESIDGK